jgi:hypothetical protein
MAIKCVLHATESPKGRDDTLHTTTTKAKRTGKSIFYKVPMCIARVVCYFEKLLVIY